MHKAASFLVILILCGCKSLLPGNYKNSLTDEPWKNIRFAKSSEPPFLSDSMVIMRSNRAFHPEKEKFLADYIDSSGDERTFLVSVKNGKWLVHLLPDINSGIELTGKKQNLVVYVEGMGKNFFLAAQRGLAVSSQYKVSVIMMDYPSTNPLLGMTKNFRAARKNSLLTAPCLINLMKELDNNKKTGKEWTNVNRTLFVHSMGNIMLRQILMEHSDTAISPGLFSLVVLNAACTDEKRHDTWLNGSKLGKNFIVNYNKDDKQLNGAQLLTFTKQLGVKPKRPLADNVLYVDFNPLVGSRHSTFVDIPLRPPIDSHARNYFSFIFNGLMPEISNKALFSPARNGIGYYIK